MCEGVGVENPKAGICCSGQKDPIGNRREHDERGQEMSVEIKQVANDGLEIVWAEGNPILRHIHPKIKLYVDEESGEVLGTVIENISKLMDTEEE